MLPVRDTRLRLSTAAERLAAADVVCVCVDAGLSLDAAHRIARLLVGRAKA